MTEGQNEGKDDSMDDGILNRFRTPRALPLTEYDARVTASAAKTELPFEGSRLTVYGWGEGKTVLLIHGWGSRASHLALLGRALAKEGFHAVVPDMPAHSSRGFPEKRSSSMFEYCRAIGTIAAWFGPVYAIVGHSFGAICAAFAVAGLGDFAGSRAEAGRLVLVSSPPTIGSVLESFCLHDLSGAAGLPGLEAELEREFDFRVADYTIARALPGISARVLFIHDDADEEFPVAGNRAIHEAFPSTMFFVTHGSGHQKILGNRAMIGRVKDFLLGDE
jgi:pimeloyl-ACP methyl ester carboxylesterase